MSNQITDFKVTEKALLTQAVIFAEWSLTMIDRKSDDAVGERDLLVLQAVSLAAEQDADGAAAGDAGHDFPRRGFGGDHRLGLVVGARGGGEGRSAVQGISGSAEVCAG